MLRDDPLWFKDAIIYEVPVRAFADSNSDGIGDFGGLSEKLDYLQDLGVTAIWTLPFFPSPLRDDGYDIADYKNINPIYGSLEDFQKLLYEAHQRGIRVIIELIVNHTSDRHPWFQRARRAPKGSKERDFYVWSDTQDKFQEVRIIFQDFENSNWAWDPVAKAYYWHRFYSHQPDLNYESPEVQEAVLEVVDFWLSMGVDGLRMDAVPYLCVQEGTSCENLPETHAFLKKLRARVDAKFPNRMLLAEANQWPEDAAKYYGAGDECQMNFHFPLMPRLFMALRLEDNFPISDILNQTPSIPDNCQWALFLRNHDELTLEMVSDEDRDYMYRVYAEDTQARLNLGIRRRLAPLLGNDRRQVELLNSLLLSLPGTPVLYYGDEIGMGDNIYLGDRNGVRTPMQWSADRNAGFSRTNPQKLYAPVILDPEYHYESINVEAQQGNSNSLWWWMKKLIATRERFQAFGRGTFELLHPENRKVIAFTRTYAGQHILVVANLSRFVQTVELDLSAFQGMMPVEIFGRTKFPVIEEEPYFVCLGPYGFYWFTLQLQQSLTEGWRKRPEPPTLTVVGQWQKIFSQPELKTKVQVLLSNYLYGYSWFYGQTKVVQSAEITEVIPISEKQTDAVLVFLELHYTEGAPETYLMPVSYEPVSEKKQPPIDSGEIIAYLKTDKSELSGIIYDATGDKEFLTLPLQTINNKKSYAGRNGELKGTATEMFYELAKNVGYLQPQLLESKHNKTPIAYGSSFIIKLYRKLEAGINPDLEIGRFLTHKATSQLLSLAEHIPLTLGALEYKGKNSQNYTVGVLKQQVSDPIDAWSYTLDNLRSYYERITVKQQSLSEVEIPSLSVKAILEKPEVAEVVGIQSSETETTETETRETQKTETETTELAYELIGLYLNSAQLLGERTAEIHKALSDSENPDFAPEPFTSFYQRSIYQYKRNLAGQVLLDLKQEMPKLSPEVRQLAQTVINRKEQLMSKFASVLDLKITAMRTRCHGDFHLENVLYTGKNFVIINFEGEPPRPLSERRMKRSPLRDVAGMLQSFYYAATIALREEIKNGTIRSENVMLMEQWGQYWYSWVGATFLKSYLNSARSESFIPKTEEETQILLDAYMLEKAVYELSYELENRPEWLEIPLSRILQLVEG
jgi:maltose alpha-D-glucosyltransferase/alpha-amylase